MRCARWWGIHDPEAWDDLSAVSKAEMMAMYQAETRMEYYERKQELARQQAERAKLGRRRRR